jgi:hypothetical protein
MKAKHKIKTSTKLLLGAGIFLALYLLVSVIFGSLIVREYANPYSSSQRFSYTVKNF